MEESKSFVVKITADASGAVGALDTIDTKLNDTERKAAGLSGSLGESAGLGAALAGQAAQMAGSMSAAFNHATSMEHAFAAASAAVEPLGEALAAEFAGVRGRFSDFSSGLTDVQARLISSQVALDGMSERIRATMAGLGADAPRKAVNELISLSNAVDKLNASYERQSDKIIDIKIQLKAATEQLESLETAQTGIVEAARKELTMAESRLAEFRAKADENIAAGFRPSKGIERSISTLEQRIEALKAGISGDHMALPGYAEYSQQTTALSSFIAQLQERLTSEEGALAKVDQKAGLYGTRINALADAQEKAAAAAGGSAGRFGKLGTILAGIGSGLASVAGHAISFAKSIGSIGLAGLRNIRSMAGRIADKIKDWNKHTMSAGDAVKALHRRFTGFFRMMATRLKRMAISAIFKDISSTSGQIAQVSTGYNAAISGMVTSSRAFGAQLVAIMEPVISVVGPAISRVIDLLTAGADRLAQFTARLAGRDTYIKANKGLYDYAASLDSSSESAKKAAKATQAFKSSVMSFDELHKLEGMETSDDASELTGVTDSQLSQAKTQATAFNEVADRLRKAWGRGDYGAVGLIAAQQVGKAFDWLKNVAGWSANADRFRDILSGISDAINGFFSGLNGGRIGAAIADVANTVLNGAAILVDQIDAVAIGSKIGSIVSSFAQTVDWGLAGQNLIAGLQFVVDTAAGFLNTDALASLGTGVAEFFAGIAAAFDPSRVGSILAEAVNGIAQFLASAFRPEVFAEAGEKVAEMVNTLFASISPDRLADGLNAFVGSISSFINSALSSLDWAAIGQTLGEIGSQLDWGSIFEIIGLAALPALIPAVVGMIGKALAAAAAAAGAGVPLLIAGVVAAVVAALVLNWDTVKEWASGVWDKIKEWGGKIGDFFSGLIGGIVDGLKGIGEFIGGIGSGIVDGVKGAGAWIGDKWNSAKDFVTGGSDVTETTVPDSIVASGAAVLTETSLACADAETVLSRLNAGFNATIQQATTMILNALGQSGDVVLYVDSERLARATVRGLNTADLRQNATPGGVAFI